MFKRQLAIGFASAVVMSAGPSLAQDLVYSPVNPSFGGSPLNSSHLLSLANAQRDATASDAEDDAATGPGGTSGTGTSTTETDVQLFVRQLQGRLLSALASQVTEAIFGENPQDNGTVTFGGTTVQFERTLGAITLTITDSNGVVTVISVPTLVVNGQPAATQAALAPASSNSLSGSSSLTSSPLSSGALTGSLNP